MPYTAQVLEADPMPTLPYRSECFAEDVWGDYELPPAPPRESLRWRAVALFAAPLGVAVLSALTPAVLA